MSKQTQCENCEDFGHRKQECKSLPKANLEAALRKDVRRFEYREPKSEVRVIDTHCHMDSVFERVRHAGSFAQFRAKYDFPNNIAGFIASFSDPICFALSTYENLLREEGAWGTFGVHPHCAKFFNDDIEDKVLSCLSHPKALAVGECGLDYSIRSASPKDQQHIVFKKLLRVAIALQKPVVIHCREAEVDCFDIMRDILPATWHIHLHCYTGNMEQAQQFMEHFTNLYFGVTNLVTYNTATQVHQIATDLPLRRLLLETDAPYFVPQRLKNSARLSHPGMVMHVASKIAQFHNCSLDKVLETCQQNAQHLYGIKF
eukprot:gene6274-6995_t